MFSMIESRTIEGSISGGSTWSKESVSEGLDSGIL